MKISAQKNFESPAIRIISGLKVCNTGCLRFNSFSLSYIPSRGSSHKQRYPCPPARVQRVSPPFTVRHFKVV